jgi:HK97 family phage prohead protease
MPEFRTIERRTLAAPELRIERRATTGGQPDAVLVGYASVFDEWTTILETDSWRFREIVRPGAYRAAIAERQDVRCLLNHDPNFVLGRTASGTLSLEETDRGLLQRTRLSEAQWVRDLVSIPVDRGDISGMSFSFNCRNGASQTTVDKGDGRVIVRRDGERLTEYMVNNKLCTDRELLAVDLYDVTVATYPAYAGTNVGHRTNAPNGATLADYEAECRALFAQCDPCGAAWIKTAAGRIRLALCD